MKIKDLTTVFLDISKEFNISKFLDVLLDSFLRSDDTYEHKFSETLASVIKTVPLNNMVDLTSKVLSKCVQQGGDWARTILLAIKQTYPDELLATVERFLDTEVQIEWKLDTLSQMLSFLGLDKGALGDAFTTTVSKRYNSGNGKAFFSRNRVEC